MSLALVASMTSCGDTWLETQLPNGIDLETALDNPDNVGIALNGTYFRLFNYRFAGDYAILIGDVCSDDTYSTLTNGQFRNLYQFVYQDTESILYYIWNYGYKVADNSARVIQATQKLIPSAEGYELEDLMLYEAEARCLRAYANLTMVNIFCHQAMVSGTSYLNEPGLVLVDEPIEAYAQVSRATVGETYNFIVNDLTAAIDLFEELGYDRGELQYFNLPAAYGLLARANMYLENWGAAATAAQNAIDESGITSLCYTTAAYNALYNNATSNNESFFALAITPLDNWSANSCGTLYSTYGYSVSPYLASLYSDDDCRKYLITLFSDPSEPYDNNYMGGKFWYGGGNSAYATNYIVNAPEMFLIQAEAYANLNQISNAQDALLVVAKRDNSITSTADLPSTQSGLLSFLRDERARELFQEGFRLWDLRRWNVTCNLYATDAPDVAWNFNNTNVGNLVFPIPVDEINAGFGVTQNTNWYNTKPTNNP